MINLPQRGAERFAAPKKFDRPASANVASARDFTSRGRESLRRRRKTVTNPPRKHSPPAFERQLIGLLQRSHRNAGDARRRTFAPSWRHRGAEENVPERKPIDEIPIDVFGRERMVDAMIIRAHQQPPERAEAEIYIGMREIKPGIGNERKNCDRDRRYLKKDRGRNRDKNRCQDQFKNVMTGRRRHVHVLVAMMQNVQLPEQLDAVLGAVLPILQQIPDQGSDQKREKAAAYSLKAQCAQIDEAEADVLDRIGGGELKKRRQRADGKDVDKRVAQIERVVLAGDLLRRE